MPDIVDIAVGADAFKTLVAAVQAADLVDALKSPGPFTVFAPVDDAFAALPPGTVQTLVQNPPSWPASSSFMWLPESTPRLI